MAQEETKVEDLTEEQKAAALAAAEHGRQADLNKKADADDEEHGTPLEKDKQEETTEEDKKEEEETSNKSDDESWKEEWVSTGNADADAAIEIMKEAGVKPVEGNEIFKDALDTGDLSKVRWDLLEARIGAAKARLVRNGVEAYYNNEYAEQIKVRDEAYEAVGGEKNWTKIQTWAAGKEKKDAAFKSELADWRKALGVGGFAARSAVKAIIEAYNADSGNTTVGNTKAERGTAKPGKQTVGEPLSRAGYFDALERAGGDRAPESVKQALWARRQAGQQAGI